MKNKVHYMDNGCVLDSVTRKPVATTDDEESARYAAACINGFLGVDVERIEKIAVLPMFIEMQRLREQLSQVIRDNNGLKEQVVEYEKALANNSDKETY